MIKGLRKLFYETLIDTFYFETKNVFTDNNITNGKIKGSEDIFTSLTLAFIDLNNEYELVIPNLMENYLFWLGMGKYSYFSQPVENFSTEMTHSLQLFSKGNSIKECSRNSELSNDDSTLQRSFALPFYFFQKFGSNFFLKEEANLLVWQFTILTNGHKRSVVALGIFLSISVGLIEEKLSKKRTLTTKEARYVVRNRIENAIDFYNSSYEYRNETGHFSLLGHSKTNSTLYIEKASTKDFHENYCVHTITTAIKKLLYLKESDYFDPVNKGTRNSDIICNYLFFLAYGKKQQSLNKRFKDHQKFIQKEIRDLKL